jgi:sugar O-acyltransferase (sialic acid O-acetyltransferase NeuD family)
MRLVIIGGGGHGRVVAEAAFLSGLTDLVVVDPHAASEWPLALGKCVKTVEEAGIFDADAEFVVAIGDNLLRQTLYKKYIELSLKPRTVAHPAANISPSAIVGPGCMIMAGSVVGPLAQLGCGVIVNHGAIAEHDTSVDDFSHLAPGAVLAGAAILGKRSFLGANSCVKHRAIVGDDILVGHGAVVARSITEAGIYIGNPAHLIEKQRNPG